MIWRVLIERDNDEGDEDMYPATNRQSKLDCSGSSGWRNKTYKESFHAKLSILQAPNVWVIAQEASDICLIV